MWMYLAMIILRHGSRDVTIITAGRITTHTHTDRQTDRQTATGWVTTTC